MFVLRIASFTLPLFLSQALLSVGSGLPVKKRAELGLIEALLRTPYLTSESGLVQRQTGTCAIGYLACSDGSGCCAVGEYCGTWDGKLGCCPIGKSCTSNSSQCDYKGYLPCSGESFCCPAGDFCGRDSSGAPKCSKSSSGGDNDATTTKRTTTAKPSTTLTDTFTFDTFTDTFFDTFTDIFPTTSKTTSLSRSTVSTSLAQPTTGDSIFGPLSGDDTSDSKGNGVPATAGGVNIILLVAGIAIAVYTSYY